MAGRPHTSTLIEARAECQRCNWRATGKNALGLASQHFDKKCHQVRVTTTTEIIYGRHSGKTRDGADKQESML